jgi:hypothetical protein
VTQNGESTMTGNKKMAIQKTYTIDIIETGTKEKKT